MKRTKPIRFIAVVIILASLSTGVLTYKRKPVPAPPPYSVVARSVVAVSSDKTR